MKHRWGAIAILLGAAAWGSTGTAAHFAPSGATATSIGAARIAIGGAGLLIVALSTAANRQAVARLLARRGGTGQDAADNQATGDGQAAGRGGDRTAPRGVGSWRVGSWRVG